MYYTFHIVMSKDFKSTEHKRSTPISYRPSKEAMQKLEAAVSSLKKQKKKATYSQIIEQCILTAAAKPESVTT